MSSEPVAHLKSEDKDDELLFAIRERVLDEAKARANQQHRHKQQNAARAVWKASERVGENEGCVR